MALVACAPSSETLGSGTTGAGGAGGEMGTQTNTTTSATGGGGGAPPACEFPAGTTMRPRVRVIYLVPSDRTEVPLYRSTLEKTIREVQLWYEAHIDSGNTFEVHDPVVEVHTTPNPAAYYAMQATPSEMYYWFWDNVLTDGFALTGGMFFDPDNVWLFYIDADNGCGQIGGGGTSGVAVLPANDLRGLAGEANQPPCQGDPPDNLPRCRWVGGLGHELGHALGLSHPLGCDMPDPGGTPCDDSALLWLGYASYPDAHFTEADQTALAASDFIAPRRLPDCSMDCMVP